MADHGLGTEQLEAVFLWLRLGVACPVTHIMIAPAADVGAIVTEDDGLVIVPYGRIAQVEGKVICSKRELYAALREMELPAPEQGPVKKKMGRHSREIKTISF